MQNGNKLQSADLYLFIYFLKLGAFHLKSHLSWKQGSQMTRYLLLERVVPCVVNKGEEKVYSG